MARKVPRVTPASSARSTQNSSGARAAASSSSSAVSSRFRRDEDFPFRGREVNVLRVVGLGELLRFAPDGHAAAADMADAEGEDTFGGHHFETLRAGKATEKFAVFRHGVAVGDFERGPEPILGTCVSRSVERITMWPEKGSFSHMKSKAALSFSGGTLQATRAPRARLMDMRVWRTRRIVPARSMAMMRSETKSSGNPQSVAIC